MKVKIINLAKNPMQSGLGKNNLWLVTTFEEDNSRFINSLTGWTASVNTKTQIKLKFKSKEDAIQYAKSQNFEYVIEEANASTIKPKSYAENFIAPILK